MKIRRKKKVTKKELRKDPFIDFADRAYKKLKERPREFIGGFLLILAIILLIFVLRSGQSQDFPMARQMWFQAISLMQAQRTQEALNVFQDISIRFPDSPEGKKALFYLANFAFLQGDYVTAKARYESYLSKKPDDFLLEASSLEALGTIDFIMGNVESGKKRILKAIDKVPYRTFKSLFAYRLINFLIEKGYYKDAYNIFQKFKDKVTVEFKDDFLKFESFLKGVLEL
ncbi:MAG: tetratricopeptide repeat protein [Candidatus Hydrothermales bacterium]